MAPKKTRFSRRDFIKVSAAAAGAAAAGPLLAACQPAAPAVTPTSTALPPTATAAAPTAVPGSMPELVKFYPAVPSRVVRTHHAGAWADAEHKTLTPEVLRQMLDASITRLTGLADARSAWAALFRPGEKIAIKVNAFSNSIIWTHAPLVMEVTKSLIEAGMTPEDITIYDFRTAELTEAGFTVNPDGPGVRCVGMDSNYEKDPTEVMTSKIKLATILKDCDALINMPVLKSHMLSGITFALKNHYGSIYYPDLLHSYQMKEIAALNALKEIKDRTRLIIGDALSANLRFANSYPYWQEDWYGDSIFMSFDPVAHDALGLKLLVSELEKDGGSGAALVGMSTPYLTYATELGLGTRDEANIELVEQTLA
jgi:hypothetical protein